MNNISKKCISQFTNSTTNKGVEAREIEIANARLDVNESGSSQLEGESSCRLSAAEGECAAPAQHQLHHHSSITADDSTSFIQVVVQKHRSRREPPARAASAQTSPRAPAPTTRATPRLPAASSPLHSQQIHQVGEAGAMYMMPPPLLLSYPCTTTHYSWPNAPRTVVEAAASQARSHAPPAPASDARDRCDTPGAAGDHRGPDQKPLLPNKRKKDTIWKKFINLDDDNLNMFENAPDRVVVYYLERCEGSQLAARGSARTTTERLAARAARRATRLLDELLAVPQILIAVPVAIFLHVERTALVMCRGLVVGAVGEAAEQALKPALATLHNALLLPALVTARAAGDALRAALAPLSAAALDAVQPLAALLASLRLVTVHYHCPAHAQQV